MNWLADIRMETTFKNRYKRIKALFQHGEEIFGSISEFRSWFNTPVYGLGNQAPYSLMQTSGGIDLIDDELYRIEFGVLA